MLQQGSAFLIRGTQWYRTTRYLVTTTGGPHPRSSLLSESKYPDYLFLRIEDAIAFCEGNVYTSTFIQEVKGWERTKPNNRRNRYGAFAPDDYDKDDESVWGEKG